MLLRLAEYKQGEFIALLRCLGYHLSRDAGIFAISELIHERRSFLKFRYVRILHVCSCEFSYAPTRRKTFQLNALVSSGYVPNLRRPASASSINLAIDNQPAADA